MRAATTSTTADVSRIEAAEAIAAALLDAATKHDRRAERRRRGRIARLLDDPEGKAFLLALTDEVVRIHDPRRAAKRLRDLISERGMPHFAGPVDRGLLWAGGRLAPLLPSVVMPLVVARLRREFAGIIVPAEPRPFGRYVASRRAEGVRLNVNVLGEAILGEEEAARRLEAVLERLRRPDVDYVSVKISAICSQLHVLAPEVTVERIAGRLRLLYAEAATHSPAKFVNLDMEEYRDLTLTTALFRRVLDEPDHRDLDAGIVLQAYLPDSCEVLVGLCEWATARRVAGGGRIKVRLVKGANLAMEAVEAELHGWPQAPYATKAEVDANYKRMLDVALDPRFADAIRVGVASHNLFDVAWALVRRAEAGAVDRVELEMLEGMANAQAMAARDAAGGLLLYAPVARRNDIESAIAYLVRRLDENTAPDNFLRSLFSLTPGSPEWNEQRDRFRAAVADRSLPSGGPRRTQDRALERRRFDVDDPFTNEPDTDWSLPHNVVWIRKAIERWRAVGEATRFVPATVAGDDVATAATGRGIDPARPHDVLYRHALADRALVDSAVATARRAQPQWAALGWEGRRRVLTATAESLAAGRGDALAVMAHDAGKTVGEADPEVSEAIDFARYDAASTRRLEALEGDGLVFAPYGTVVVASPWNFPYAIPAGGVFGALAAGNAVILKPAPETVLTARLLAEQCWAGGVPRDVLQFLPCPDDDVGRRLITHPDVDAVVLTGSWDTARLFLGWRPALALHAETSGKNALVITAAADLDLAVADLVRSAFGHAGQKCSAASLAVVEASVYDDPTFRRRLADKVGSLIVGAGWDLDADVGPLIRPPEGPLARALGSLDTGESWLVPPQRLDPDGYLWRPGVKLGVQPGSMFHLTECFGPVLGVMRADDLDHALALQNAPMFGLTGGLHSLDPAEVEHWREHVEVGNAYINRHTTGAIVQRQPFGGWKRSVVGPGAKPGGPNHVASLGSWRTEGPVDMDALPQRFRDHWREEIAVERDATGLRAERNSFRYRPYRRGVLVRAAPDVPDVDLEVVLLAARTAGVPVTVTTAADESDESLVARLPTASIDVLRLLGPASEALRLAAHDHGIAVDDRSVVADPRIELHRWVREQSVSETRHRHGNVIA